MALKVFENTQTTLPSTVKAVIAKKTASLEHQALAIPKNSQEIKKAGAFLHRSHNGNN